MQVDATAIATIIVFIALQTGALIFYAGVMLAMMRSHDRRLDQGEKRHEMLAAIVYELKGKES